MAMITIVIILLVLAVLAIIGFLLKNPRQTIIEAQFDAPISRVWDVVTNYAAQMRWRSDLKDVTVISDGSKQGESGLASWTEVPKSGPPITFHEREKVRNDSYIIDIDPASGFAGYSVIRFTELTPKTCEISFEEASIIENPYRRILSYIFYRPKKRMQLYIGDLRQAVTKPQS